jgi:hypothetical protein
MGSVRAVVDGVCFGSGSDGIILESGTRVRCETTSNADLAPSKRCFPASIGEGGINILVVEEEASAMPVPRMEESVKMRRTKSREASLKVIV